MFGYVTLDRVLNPFHADGFSWVDAVGDGFSGDLAFLRQEDEMAHKTAGQAQTSTWFGDLKEIARAFVSCLTTISSTGKFKQGLTIFARLSQHVSLDRV